MGQAAHEVGLASIGNGLILVEVALLLRALLVQVVTLARRTTTELTVTSELEAFCDRFLGLLHDFEGIDDKDTNRPSCKGESLAYFAFRKRVLDN